MKHTPEQVVLIRPGCTDYDEESRIQGTLDIPMNDRGADQLASIIAELAEHEIDVIFTGPSEPGLSAALRIGAELDVPVKEKDGLDNLDQGLWQGLKIDEIRRKFPRVYRHWQDAPESIRPPEGETLEEAQARVLRALEKPLRRRARFAVVASEPLATLVRHVVEETPLDHHHPICGCSEPRLIEILHPGAGPEGIAARCHTGDTSSAGNGTAEKPAAPSGQRQDVVSVEHGLKANGHAVSENTANGNESHGRSPGQPLPDGETPGPQLAQAEAAFRNRPV